MGFEKNDWVDRTEKHILITEKQVGDLTWNIFPANIFVRTFGTVSRQSMSFGYRQALDVVWFPGLHELRFCFSWAYARFRAPGSDFESRETPVPCEVTLAAMLLVQLARCASRIVTHVRWDGWCFVKVVACSLLCESVFFRMCMIWSTLKLFHSFVNLGRSITATGFCWK